LHNTVRSLGALIALSLLSACTGGQSAQAPSVVQATVSTNKAELAVGVATFSDGTKGLNAVATFRQPDGSSATLLNTPTLTGPSAFVVPPGAPSVDAGTNHISASPQVTSGTPTDTTFGISGGVFSYGFAPANSDISGTAYFNLYSLPFYGDSTLTGTFTDTMGNAYAFEGGPPAYPNVRTGTYPAGFDGYTQGFTVFDAAPVAGAYSLSVVVASSNAGTTTVTSAPATLHGLAGLGAVATPTFTEDGTGGGTAAFVAPAGTTESVVDFYDITAGTYFSVLVAGAGAHTAMLPDAVGIYASGVAGTTLAANDAYEMTVICVDYPLFAAGPPQNTVQLPTLLGAAGQADIAFAPVLSGTYGSGAAPASSLRRARRKR
jgi:hypothetical protein